MRTYAGILVAVATGALLLLPFALRIALAQGVAGHAVADCGSVTAWAELFSRVGFPSMVAVFVLWRIEPKLDAMRDALGRWGERVGRRNGDR